MGIIYNIDIKRERENQRQMFSYPFPKISQESGMWKEEKF
jgi:hypothetical protein